MSATVIKDFLVAIGFKSDSTGAKKMNDELVSVENRVKLLQQAFIGMATSIVGAVAKTSGEMEKLYYSSQRIGASAGNIRAFQGAISQMGGSAEGAMQSMEALAQKIRQSPGMEKMVQGIGVATREANGEMRDQVEMYKDFHKQLSGMDYYRANAYGNAFGWDENTLMVIRDPAFAKNLDKYQALQKSMGMNDDLAKSGKEFATEWRDLMMMSKALAEVIIMTAGEALIPVFKAINSGLQAAIKWFGNLDPGIKKFLATALKIGTLIVVFGGLFGAISKLARVLPILRGLIFLIRGLSLAFFMSPIGIVLALAAAIALLWNDYQVWKEGGKSLIDWKEWEPAITELVGALTTIKDLFSDLIAKAAEFAGMDITPETAGAAGTAAMTGIGLFGAKNILKRFPLIAAGMTGYEVGGLVNEKFVEGTSFGDKLGEGIAKGLAAVGVESAKEAVAMNEKNRALLKADAGNSVAQGADKGEDNKVTETADKVSDKVTDKSLSQVATDIFSTVAQKGNEVRKEIESGLGKTVSGHSMRDINPVIGKDRDQNRLAVYKAFLNAGIAPNQAMGITAEVGRENDYKASVMFGKHTDPAKDGKGKSITNLGFISWNRERANRLNALLASRGLLDKNGNMIRSQAALDAQAEFAVAEMRSDAYKDKLAYFWNNPNADPETFAATLGGDYVGWAYKQKTIRGPNGDRIPFDSKREEDKRRGYLKMLQKQVANIKTDKVGNLSNLALKDSASLADFASNAEMPSAILLHSGSLPTSTGNNVTINQSHKTDITINGAENPQTTANRIQQHAENIMSQMSKNAQGILK